MYVGRARNPSPYTDAVSGGLTEWPKVLAC